MNSSKKYKVLWFDDQYETLTHIIEQAIINDIELVGFTNAKDGLQELETNFLHYDAIIVDGIFYSSSSEKGNATTTKAFGEVAKFLNRIEDKKKLPWFVLSGQPKFTKSANELLETFKDGKFYDKLDNAKLDELWLDIKQEADAQIDTQLKHKYSKVFEICDEKYIGESSAISLLQCVKQLEDSESINSQNEFNNIRKIIELLFNKLHEISVVPSEIFQVPQWFNPTSYFLSGSHKQYKIKEGLIHPCIAFSLRNLTQVTQDASHTLSEKLNLKVDQFISENQTNYFYQSMILQLFDVLIWFKKFIDEHSNKFETDGYWEKVETEKKEVDVAIKDNNWIAGTITRIADNGFGTFKPDNSDKTFSIIPSKIKEHLLKENQRIEVITKQNGDKTQIQEIRTN
jgi:hypothetical protein